MTRIIKAEQAEGQDAPRAAVLKLADLAAEARALVLEARKESARIVADARAGAEEAERHAGENGYAEGYARGQESGYAEGRRQALAETRDALAAESADLIPLAQKAVEELVRAQARFTDDAGREIVRLAGRIAEKVVGRLAAADIGAAQENLSKALALASRHRQWTVRVNPGQLAALREGFGELTDALGLSGEVRWVADERIAPGGVKLLTPRGEIDATIETQLANVADALLGPALADRPAGDEGAGEAYVSEAPQPADAGREAPPDSHKVIRALTGWRSDRGQDGV